MVFYTAGRAGHLMSYNTYENCVQTELSTLILARDIHLLVKGELLPLASSIYDPPAINFHLLQAASVVGQDSGVLDTLECERNCSPQTVEGIITMFSWIPLTMTPKIFNVI